MQRRVYIENMPLETARKLWMEGLASLGFFEVKSEPVNVLDSLNRITGEAVTARRSSPDYQAAAMDGIAVKAGSTYGASERSPVILEKDQYLEVDTGDYVPGEYDAVIMIEDVNYDADSVRIIKPAVPWQHIRSIGEDLVDQDMLLPSYTRIGPFEWASLITAAVDVLSVVKAPRVGIIPTGTELVETGADIMAPGKIIDSNSRMLAGLCQEWGAFPIRHPIVADDREKLKRAVLDLKDQVDMLVICSGSSAGREDYTAGIIEETGRLLVHGIAIRPGKPVILGIIADKPVIGVPGYPVSAQLVFHLFARTALLRRQGLREREDPALPARISRKLASSMGVDEFIYVNCAHLPDGYHAYPLNRGAGITTSLVKSDGFIRIPRGSEGLEAGEICQVHLRRPRQTIDPTLVCIGSHDLALDILADLLQRRYGWRMISSNVGSMGGLMALRREETHVAGLHLLDTVSGEYNTSYLNRYLPDRNWQLLTLVQRQQGLMVKKGNPLKITGLADLTRPSLRFVNRQKGSGTRILLDYLLAQERLSADSIYGYTHEEYTHLAVAAAVKNDACDVGLGIYAGAKVLDLDFIPIAEESYDLCILPHFIEETRLCQLIDTIRSSEFQDRVAGLGGYNLHNCGMMHETS